jgi:hypothetical protein
LQLAVCIADRKKRKAVFSPSAIFSFCGETMSSGDVVYLVIYVVSSHYFYFNTTDHTGVVIKRSINQ